VRGDSSPGTAERAAHELAAAALPGQRQARPLPPTAGANLLPSKLEPPQLPPGLVSRPRLMEVLEAGASGRVTLVSAGPGWGKTMLVASWAAARSPAQLVAWLSVDSFDNDPVLFWSYMSAAVHRIGEAPGGTLGSLEIRPPVGQDVLRRIILGFSQLRRPLTLILDDFGEIHNQEILDGIADVLRHPSPLHLLLVTRSDPRLHLHRLRVDGQLTELRAADLAFTAAESDELLARSGVQLPAAVNRLIRDRTEGWAAGLRLAAMFAVTHGQGARIEEFTGVEIGVAEYLVEEVIAVLPAQRRRFLVRTCVADRTCAELADVLIDGTGSQRELEALEQANAFVVAIGADRRWFRYHPLLVDLLRHRLLLDEPELLSELHRRAAQWFAGQGQAVEAVRHAIRAYDWQLVGDLMVNGGVIRALSAERQALAALLAEIPATELRSSAALRATAATACLLARDYAAFRHHVTHARALLSELDEVSRQPIELFLCAADLVLSRVQGNVADTIAAAEQLLRWLSKPELARLPAVSMYEAPALSNLGLGLVWSAQVDEAERPLRESLGVAAQAKADLAFVNSLGYLALIEWERGHLQAANEVAGQGLKVIEQRGWTEQLQAIAVYLVLARVELERNHRETAQIFLDAALAAQRNDPDGTPYAALRATQARLLLAAGQLDRAREVMVALHAELDGGLSIAPLSGRWVAVVTAEIDLARGHPATARARLRSLLATEGQGSSLATNASGGTAGLDEVKLCLARAEEMLGNPTAAEEIVASLRERSSSPLIKVQSWLITALAADRNREDHRALVALDQALAIAEPEDIRRPLVTLGHRRLKAMLHHRQRLSGGAQSVAAEFVETLLKDIGSLDRVAVLPMPLAEPLTDREHVVLSHMATFQTNEEIAAELFISINTVKAHARQVYRKLAVSNRRTAVQRARELGLI
jgi:LuxR family transcriptional regulator, maltose regulon positive regulatory protein